MAGYGSLRPDLPGCCWCSHEWLPRGNHLPEEARVAIQDGHARVDGEPLAVIWRLRVDPD